MHLMRMAVRRICNEDEDHDDNCVDDNDQDL